MKRVLLAALSGAICLGLLLTMACGGEDEETTGTPTPTATVATPGSPTPASPAGTPITPGTSGISARGEEVERIANSVVREVEWEDGSTQEGSISDLVFRSAGKPKAGHGHRVVARWLGDTRWQVTIYMRVVDRSTEPATVTDLVAEFYYDENEDEFTAANGRAVLALTGRDPCAPGQEDPDYCPLDEEITP
ncbi:MAG: hypothetical protein ACUVX1_02810 [Chloroflexota bacterium]